MVMMLRGLQGPYKNRYFVLKAGMTIGRKAGDILLEDDPMVSSLHGRIIGRGDGRFMLEDAGSQNQFLVNGIQMPKVDLNEGVTFQVGQSVFEVFSAKEEDIATLKPEKSWKEMIFDILEKNHNVRNEAKPLVPSVKVECTLGPNAEDSWFLGFGPRHFGPICDDIEILEKNASDIAFEIRQGEYGPVLINKSNELFINKTSVKNGGLWEIRDGDEVEIGVSQFILRLVE